MLLSQELKKWAISNGFKPLWNSTRDYMIYNTINITGKSTDDALTQLGQIFISEHYGLVIKLYEKNNVLVIDAQ
ncbi:pilus assembly protein [Citrobacter arsenatis]|uniref:Pilus assembly protein n=2 Tax=Citrobacter arsenatis TaxID=2546350 RepID=A0A4P6WV03_9ENTR|nr:pilus assembly protein [Citrobacter arsenatis]